MRARNNIALKNIAYMKYSLYEDPKFGSPVSAEELLGELRASPELQLLQLVTCIRNPADNKSPQIRREKVSPNGNPASWFTLLTCRTCCP